MPNMFGQAAGALAGAMGGGNGGSFAQKQQMKANPMMAGRPAMSAGAQIGQNMMKNKQSMQPNPLTGQRPGMNPGMMGMKGPKQKLGLGPSIPQQGQMPMPQVPMGNQDPNRAYSFGPYGPGGAISRPDVMPRAPEYDMGAVQSGLGPSNPMEMMGPNMNGGMGPMQTNEPVQMDENGLEPRRGPR